MTGKAYPKVKPLKFDRDKSEEYWLVADTAFGSYGIDESRGGWWLYFEGRGISGPMPSAEGMIEQAQIFHQLRTEKLLEPNVDDMRKD